MFRKYQAQLYHFPRLQPRAAPLLRPMVRLANCVPQAYPLVQMYLINILNFSPPGSSPSQRMAHSMLALLYVHLSFLHPKLP